MFKLFWKMKVWFLRQNLHCVQSKMTQKFFCRKMSIRKSVFLAASVIFFFLLYIRLSVKHISDKIDFEDGIFAESKSDKDMKNTGKRKVVILFSNKRSGSSFVGELLNQNPNAFYLFEPLFPFTRTCETLIEDRVDLLKKLINCDLSNLLETYKYAFRITGHTDLHAKCVRNHLCFYERHKQLLTKYSKKCKAEQKSGHYCGFPIKLDILSSICKTSSIVAFKILRICDIASLETVLSELEARSDVTLKFIHLVRDPRAIMNSRLLLGEDKTNEEILYSEAKLLCERLVKNSEYADQHWKNRPIKNFSYLRVRLEDLASQSMLNVSKIIYNFIQEKLPKEVVQWIKRTDVENNKVVKVDPNPFGTRRKSQEVINGWRSSLELNQVEGIQKECIDALNKLNYIIIQNDRDQKDLSKRLFR